MQNYDGPEKPERIAGRWNPGESGNPTGKNAGRPKGSSFMRMLEKELDEEQPGLPGSSRRRALAQLLVKKALAWDTFAVAELLKRIAPEKLLLDITERREIPAEVVEAEEAKLAQLLSAQKPEEIRSSLDSLH